eukprot:10885-Rhodomonas_salina.1
MQCGYGATMGISTGVGLFSTRKPVLLSRSMIVRGQYRCTRERAEAYNNYAITLHCHTRITRLITSTQHAYHPTPNQYHYASTVH